jgi:predicted NUDIX family NTP pyrophosphohydrolase
LSPSSRKAARSFHAWACEGDCDPDCIRSNTFIIEWPPHSGKRAEFPEIDRAGFFDLAAARIKIKAGQEGLLRQLEAIVKATRDKG